jgi:uncharacterized protein (TIGR01319 family)
VTAGSEEIARIMVSPEPLAKRTVEGDLGVYINMDNLINLIGKERLEQELGFPPEEAIASYRFVPKGEAQTRLVERLSAEAALRAVQRHAGRIRHIYGPSGRTSLAEGKDLTQVKYILGTGGALTRLPGGVEALRAIPAANETGLYLYPPETVSVLLDNDYIMASLGVLSKRRPADALALLKKSFRINKEVRPMNNAE